MIQNKFVIAIDYVATQTIHIPVHILAGWPDVVSDDDISAIKKYIKWDELEIERCGYGDADIHVLACISNKW